MSAFVFVSVLTCDFAKALKNALSQEKKGLVKRNIPNQGHKKGD